MSTRWPKPCKICKGLSERKCLFCGWKKPKAQAKKVSQMTNAELAVLSGIRERKQFMFDMDSSSTRAGNCSTQLPEMDQFLKEHREWCLKIYSRVNNGVGIKTICEEEQLTSAFVKSVVRMTGDKLIRGEFELEVRTPVVTNVLPEYMPGFPPTKRKPIEWEEECEPS